MANGFVGVLGGGGLWRTVLGTERFQVARIAVMGGAGPWSPQNTGSSRGCFVHSPGYTTPKFKSIVILHDKFSYHRGILFDVNNDNISLNTGKSMD